MPGYGQNTDVDAAAEALVAAETLAQFSVTIKAAAGNGANFIYVGNSDSVSATTGFQLAAGAEQTFPVGWFGTDLRGIYVIGSAANLAVSYWYV